MTLHVKRCLTVLATVFALLLAAPADAFEGCAAKPSSSLVVNVKDKGAKGDGHTNDTARIQNAINEVAGTGGTVFVPDGVYMVRATGKGRLRLRSKMTLKLSDHAVLKVIPNRARSYSVLRIGKVKDVNVIGGTLLGDRAKHEGKAGEWGMGIRIGPEVKRVAIVGVTAKEMWGDGFYVEGATDVALCSVVATHNRRQGLSIIEAKRLLVTNSVFQQTRGTLAMLAQWISWAHKDGFVKARREPLITLGSAPLSDRDFRDQILDLGALGARGPQEAPPRRRVVEQLPHLDHGPRRTAAGPHLGDRATLALHLVSGVGIGSPRADRSASHRADRGQGFAPETPVA